MRTIVTLLIMLITAMSSGCSALQNRSLENDAIVAQNLIELVCYGVENENADAQRACEYADAIIKTGDVTNICAAADCANKYGVKSDAFFKCILEVDAAGVLAERLKQTRGKDETIYI